MAIMIPDPPIDFHGSPGERAVYEALRTLPDNVHVFHSLRWIRAPGTSVAPQGESDFLVFDPDGRALRHACANCRGSKRRESGGCCVCA
jgi:hypothetical protein